MAQGFQKGASGNPAGRPKGARAKATMALERILEGDAEAIVRKATELAMEGDPVALRLTLERLIPARRDRLVPFALPPIKTAADLPKATGALLDAVAAGEITPSEAEGLSKLVTAHLEAIRVVDQEIRLAKLEEHHGIGSR